LIVVDFNSYFQYNDKQLLQKIADVESSLKVYIYDLHNFKAKVGSNCSLMPHYFWAEQTIPMYIKNHKSVKTINPNEAQLFIIAHDTLCKRFIEKESSSTDNIMKHIIYNFPYYNRSMGKDHVLINSFDFSLDCDRGNNDPKRGILENVTLVQNIGHKGCMRIGQDIVIPQYNSFIKLSS